MASPIVTVHVWGISARRIPQAFANMARGNGSTSRRAPASCSPSSSAPGGDDFNVTDPDPLHWVLLTVWEDAKSRGRGRRTAGRTTLGPDRGRAVAHRPETAVLARAFGPSGSRSARSPTPTRHEGPVAAITRARLVPGKALTFWRAVPPVAHSLRELPRPGHRLRHRRGADRIPGHLQRLGVGRGAPGLCVRRRSAQPGDPADRRGRLVRRRAVLPPRRHSSRRAPCTANS